MVAPQRQKVQQWLPRPGGVENGELVSNGDGVSGLHLKRVQGTAGGDGCTTV